GRALPQRPKLQFESNAAAGLSVLASSPRQTGHPKRQKPGETTMSDTHAELEPGHRAFASFRVLTGETDNTEREQLFRNMAQLFTYVSDRCDDDQVAQYDEVLCQLAELVEVEARAHVAKL